MPYESSFAASDEYARAMREFRQIAGEDAPQPAHPEVVLKIRELWLRNRDTIDREGANPAQWNQAVMRDTLSMLNSDPGYRFLGLPDMTEEGVREVLGTYFGITNVG